MTHRSTPGPDRHEIAAVIELVAREAVSYLRSLDDRPVRSPQVEAALHAFHAELPEAGAGALTALRELLEHAPDAAASNSGRFFHFVIGGSTPAALGADWVTSYLDQVAYAWVSSPLAVELEVIALDWLKSLFSLPREWTGIMTTGATMANVTCLCAAREWWGERHGVRVGDRGLSGLPPVPVFSSGFVHASAVKALGMLGIGRSAVTPLSRDAAGRLDLDGLDQRLRALAGAPAIMIANAGEVNAGEFDPVGAMADLAHRYNAWLHVDGAFGLFARVSPRTAALAAGAERAHSVTADGHKWLNVPYDCGFAFVRDRVYLQSSFAYVADYLPGPADPKPNMGAIGPESSRRARALAVWATLRAYGRDGVRAMIERHLDLAQYLARRVDESPDLERLADVPLNIVCFRYRPEGLDGPALDRLNERLGDALLRDGRVYVGTTRFEGRVALRPAISNWRTRQEDVDLLVAVVRELGAELA